MPKTKISEFSATPGNNTDIDGINISEGCPPSGINDAIRELMSQLKDFQAGTAGDSFNGPIGTTTPAAGVFTNLSASGTFALTGDQVQISEGGTGQTTANAAFNALAPSQSTHAGKYLKTDGTNTSWDALDISTADITGTLPVANGGTGVTSSTGTGSVVLSASPTFTGTVNGAALTLSSSLTLSGGTANGVAYLNGSKVLTTGSALTFDGTNLFTLSASAPKIRVSDSGLAADFGLDFYFPSFASSYGQVTLNGSTGGMRFVAGKTGSTGYYQAFELNGSEQARLTSTGLGIGTSSPNAGYKLDVAGKIRIAPSSGDAELAVRSPSGSSNYVYWSEAGVADRWVVGCSNGSGDLAFRSGGYTMATGTERMRLDSSGNLGLGVTPSAWVSSGKALQVGNSAGLLSSTALEATVTNNCYLNSGATAWIYLNTAQASRYQQYQGVHSWFTAGSGTAGNTISFTQAMTLDASGNLGVGTTSPSTFGALCTRRGISVAGVTGSVSASFSDGANDTLYISQDSALSRLTFAALTFNTGTTERARITSGGYFKASDNGTYVSSTGAYHELDQSANQETLVLNSTNASQTSTTLLIQSARNTTNNTYYAIDYYNTGAAAYKFRVADSGNVTNTNNSYGAISDIKLKENITDATPKLASLNQLRVVNYNFKGSDLKQIGLVAQEVEQVFPGLVETSTDRDAEGNDLGTTTKSVKYSVLVPMLLKAVQELTAMNDDLRARVAQLEAK